MMIIRSFLVAAAMLVLSLTPITAIPAVTLSSSSSFPSSSAHALSSSSSSGVSASSTSSYHAPSSSSSSAVIGGGRLSSSSSYSYSSSSSPSTTSSPSTASSVSESAPDAGTPPSSSAFPSTSTPLLSSSSRSLSSSSSAPPAGLPAGTVSLHIYVTINGTLALDFTTTFADDIASALALVYTTTAETLVPFIVVSVDVSSSRRLRDTSVGVTFLILGNITTALPPGAAATAAGNVIAGQIEAGTFVAASSGVSVPAQTVLVQAVNPDGSIAGSSSSSSSSSGPGVAQTDDDSLSAGQIAGIVVGSVAAALIITALYIGVLTHCCSGPQDSRLQQVMTAEQVETGQAAKQAEKRATIAQPAPIEQAEVVAEVPAAAEQATTTAAAPATEVAEPVVAPAVEAAPAAAPAAEATTATTDEAEDDGEGLAFRVHI